MKKLLRPVLFLLFLPIALAACSDDEGYLPAYRQELVDVLCNADGTVASIALDDGAVLRVENRMASGLEDVSRFRAFAVYIADGASARVARLTQMLSAAPQEMADSLLRTDPMTVVSAWRGGHYLNFRLAFKARNAKHFLGFADRGITTQSDGSKLLHLVFVHRIEGDEALFTTETFASCDVSPYASILLPRDSIEIATVAPDSTFSCKLKY